MAWEVTSYLRQHGSAAVRVAAALLLVASLAACEAQDDVRGGGSAAAPLMQEVTAGLPRAPGTYPILPGSLFRDQRGIYQLEWLEPGAAAPGRVAHVSRLRVLRDDQLALAIPADGTDPVLHLPEDARIGIIEAASVGQAAPGPGFYPLVYTWWYPWPRGALFVREPVYADPPRGAVPSAGADIVGSTRSTTPSPPSARVVGLRTAVSGRAGGTGAGSAVTSKNISSGRTTAPAAPASSSRSSGVSAPRSSGFSAGTGSSSGGASS